MLPQAVCVGDMYLACVWCVTVDFCCALTSVVRVGDMYLSCVWCVTVDFCCACR